MGVRVGSGVSVAVFSMIADGVFVLSALVVELSATCVDVSGRAVVLPAQATMKINASRKGITRFKTPPLKSDSHLQGDCHLSLLS